MRIEERDLLAHPRPIDSPPGPVRRLVRLAPWAVAILLGAWAAVGSLVLFPNLTNNNDEAVYLLQADALRNGHLFPPAPEYWEPFLPWFAFHSGDHFVLKYTPVHAAIIAAARTVLLSDRGALFVIAAAASATSYLLALQVLRNKRQAALAAVFFALSPLVLVQSVTYLSYLSAVALFQGFAAALIEGVRRRSGGWLAGAGLLLGTGIFARPFDALLFAAPLGMWSIWIQRNDKRAVASSAGWIALGASIPLIAMLMFFQAATGNAFDPPFNIASNDTMGFGPKSLTPGGTITDYTPALAIEGMRGNLEYLGSWGYGGLLLVALALAGLWNRRPRGPEPWLALVALTVPVGYFFFWGSYGTVRWGGPTRLGPFYYLPILVPMCILGARGFSALWSRRRHAGLLLLLVMMVFSFNTVRDAVKANRPMVEGRKQLYEPLAAAELDNALVFLPRVGGNRLLAPYALARNQAGFTGPVVWAVDRGPNSNLKVMNEFAGRVPYRLVPDLRRGRTSAPSPNFTAELIPYVRLQGPELVLDVVLENPPEGMPLQIQVSIGGRRDSFTVGAERTGSPLRLALSPGSTHLEGPLLSHATAENSTAHEGLKITVRVSDPSGGDRLLGEHSLGARETATGLEILAPKELVDLEPGVFAVRTLTAGG